MSISREERKSDSYSRVRQAVLDAVAHTYGDVSPRRIAWDLSARLHTPAYKIFRCCMELSEQGEISIRNDRIRKNILFIGVSKPRNSDENTRIFKGIMVYIRPFQNIPIKLS